MALIRQYGIVPPYLRRGPHWKYPDRRAGLTEAARLAARLNCIDLASRDELSAWAELLGHEHAQAKFHLAAAEDEIMSALPDRVRKNAALVFDDLKAATWNPFAPWHGITGMDDLATIIRVATRNQKIFRPEFDPVFLENAGRRVLVGIFERGALTAQVQRVCALRGLPTSPRKDAAFADYRSGAENNREAK